MSYVKWLVNAAAAVMLACGPDGGQSTESGTVGGETSETGGGEPGACGNAQAVPGVYCFDNHTIPSIRGPKLAVSAQFTASPPARFAVFALGGVAAMVWWEDGMVQIDTNIPSITPTTYGRLLAMHVTGSPAPDVVATGIWTAGAAPNEGGVLKPFVPSDLPESVFAESGHTIPLDLGGDGKIEYIKGFGAQAQVWREVDGTWQKDATEFPVPGCKMLVNFAHGDFNADGLIDLAYIGNVDTDHDPAACEDPAVHGIAVLLQAEVGGLQMMPMVSTAQHKFLTVLVGDFDADGRDDVSALTTSRELLLFRSMGDGQFEAPRIVGDAYLHAVGDLDGDGAAECVVSGKTGAVMVVDDPFGALKATELEGAVGRPMAVGDVNQDGVGDIALYSIVDDDHVLTLAVSNP